MKRDLLTSVVVATDFSEGARGALERAVRLPLHPSAELTLVHVIPSDIPGELRTQAIREAEAGLAKLAVAAEALAKQLGREAPAIKVDVLEGAPAKQVAKRARTAEADVVVLGRHGQRRVADLFVGTTAQKIIRLGEVPVLLVQGAPETSYSKVLVGVALESGATRVLKASRLVAPGAAVRAFHASSVPFEEYVALSGELAMSYRQEYVNRAAEELAGLVSKCRLDAETHIKPGDPRQLLFEEAKELGAQLLVVGSHGRKGLERLVLGSVAEWVLTHAATDVLVVRT